MINYTEADIHESLSHACRVTNACWDAPTIARVAADLMKHCSDIEKICDACVAAAKAARGRLTIADIVLLLPPLPRKDGEWLSAEEAFARVPKDETQAGVVCQEQMSAWAGVADLYHDGDRYGARVAFVSSYSRIVAAAKAEGRDPKWWLSAASQGGRAAADEDAVQQAVEHKQLSQGRATRAIEHHADAKGTARTGLDRLKASLNEHARKHHGSEWDEWVRAKDVTWKERKEHSSKIIESELSKLGMLIADRSKRP